MFIIQGPFPANTSLIVLPSPQLANTDSLRASVQTIYKMSGKRNTYVKRRDNRKRYRWEFLIGRNKAIELEQYNIDNAGKLALVSWRDNNYIGYLTLNPFEMSGEVSEYFRVTLEFEER